MQYADLQLEIAERAAPIRARLLAAYRDALAAPPRAKAPRAAGDVPMRRSLQGSPGSETGGRSSALRTDGEADGVRDGDDGDARRLLGVKAPSGAARAGVGQYFHC